MEFPESVRNTVENNKVGYISVQTPSGRISTNPITYYFEDGYIYFMTPRASKRFKFMQKNPEVTFTVHNGKLLGKAAGLMVQGRVESFSLTKYLSKNILTKFLKFIKKYPGNIPFYAFGALSLNKLPDERKIYKYNFMRINPHKIFYWDGYNFRRIGVKSGEIIKDNPILLARQA